MRAYTETRRGADGREYSVRYLLEPQELAGLQAAGLIGEVCELMAVCDADELLTAAYEQIAYQIEGGVVQ